MADREEGRRNFVEDNEMDGDGNRQCDTGRDALNELARMREFLAEGAIRRVFVDGIFIVRHAGALMGPGLRPRDQVDKADALESTGRLWNVNMALDNEYLNRQSHERQHDHQSA